MIDLGANSGLVSEVMARTGAHVISFEPNKHIFSELESVASRYNNIELYNVAAGTKNQSVKLYLHKDTGDLDQDLSQASSLLERKPNVSAGLYDIVNEIDFAEFLRSLSDPVESIKIDVEGYEIQLINHLLDNNALDRVRKIYVETHEKKFKELLLSTKKLKDRI